MSIEHDVDLANRMDFVENAAADLSDTKILFMFAPDGVESTYKRTNGMGRVVFDAAIDVVVAAAAHKREYTCERKMSSKQRLSSSSTAFFVCLLDVSVHRMGPLSMSMLRLISLKNEFRMSAGIGSISEE